MNLVIGGGPAGFLAAITARRADPAIPVLLVELGAEVLRKVRASGGGRCNVTHACEDPRELVDFYPRGGRELRGPFHHFGPGETAAWFADEGVRLKTEDDGRMFPVSDDSATIVDALQAAAQTAGVEVRTLCAVTAVRHDGTEFICDFAGSRTESFTRIVLATGGRTSAGAGSGGYELAAALGHTIVPAVPSLFTLRSKAPLLQDLAGVTAEVTVSAGSVKANGPLLITHKGVSGPAVLKASAWGAREFHDMDYRFELAVDWLPGTADVAALLQSRIRNHGKRQIIGDNPTPLPKRLWAAIVSTAGIATAARWADLGRGPRLTLAGMLKHTHLPIDGQTPFKEEFVTCGGVSLAEVDFRTMASRTCPGLYLAGEVLDIDGVTGGFNFQNCWTTGWLAGKAVST